MSYMFSAYGMTVEHPENWSIFINPRKPFTKETGQIKIEMLAKQESQVSFSVSWQTAPEPVRDFPLKYLDEIENTYASAMKKNGQYTFYEKEILNLQGREVGFIRSSYQTSTHILKPLGNAARLALMQSVQFCPQTQRMLIGTITSGDAYMKEHSQQLRSTLLSLRWL